MPDAGRAEDFPLPASGGQYAPPASDESQAAVTGAKPAKIRLQIWYVREIPV
ncbi:hypothetical protein RCO28_32590 [Streptomyces sp. LHD-70]|uniref:hypothetical protein n=1 Tax=Streptomyces sp. LHD-70 TaxID=3072140 RepID=UPI00280F76CD|nr:hypothetical protein [Streptomyces sp. LHD-70]MDQ8707171.1 hypothetical protein [Streptomyces sp. LHD-70]